MTLWLLQQGARQGVLVPDLMNADTILPAVSGLSNVTKQDLVDYTRSGLMTLDSQQALLPVHSSGRHPSGGHWSVLEEDPKTQGLAVGHVPDNDPREALRRQRAMFAETDIKSLHVFGKLIAVLHTYCATVRNNFMQACFAMAGNSSQFDAMK